MKGILAGVLITLTMISVGYAYTGFGICNFGKETVTEVICYGPTVLKETKVTGNVNISGPLKAQDVSLGSMNITGSVDIEASMVTGPVEVTGAFKAQDVKFQKDLSLTAHDMLLRHSTVDGSITVHSSTSKPYLKIECGTAINGSVIFSGMPGVVQITNDSLIRGKLENGEFEFVQKKCPHSSTP